MLDRRYILTPHFFSPFPRTLFPDTRGGNRSRERSWGREYPGWRTCHHDLPRFSLSFMYSLLHSLDWSPPLVLTSLLNRCGIFFESLFYLFGFHVVNNRDDDCCGFLYVCVWWRWGVWWISRMGYGGWASITMLLWPLFISLIVWSLNSSFIDNVTRCLSVAPVGRDHVHLFSVPGVWLSVMSFWQVQTRTSLNTVSIPLTLTFVFSPQCASVLVFDDDVALLVDSGVYSDLIIHHPYLLLFVYL